MTRASLGTFSKLAVLLVGGMAVFASAGTEALPRLGHPTDDALTCPDSMSAAVGTAAQRTPDYVRKVAPTAFTQPSKDLFNHARMAGYAYALYDSYVDGKDPFQAFRYPDLKLIGLIYGDPLPETERPIKRKTTVTLYGFVADEISTGRRYVVFRGTQKPAEWVRNIQAGQRPYPAGSLPGSDGAHVHAGFYKIFQSLKFETLSETKPLDEVLNSLTASHDVVFVGHSLGSALATFAGVEASQIDPESARHFRLVTVASPRVGDAGFAKMAAKIGRIDRICNLVDIVPAVPASIKGLSYVHIGVPYRVSSFDQPNLVNNVKKDGDQIGCWHSDQSYDLMLNPDYVAPKASICVAKSR